jgi:hypothetical protein
MKQKNCFLCGTTCDYEETVEPERGYFECAVCGKYVIKGFRMMRANSLEQFLKETSSNTLQEQIYIISAISRRNSIVHPELRISFGGVPDINNLIESAVVPNGPLEKIDMLLEYFYRESSHFDRTVFFNPDIEYPVCFARNPDEMKGLMRVAYELKYISEPANLENIDYEIGMHHILTWKGWERIDELRKIKPFSNQCFVAMCFDKEMISIWEKGILPAITDESVKLKPMKIDLKEHNNHIPIEILAEIKKSKILIADFTHNRGGVYFEAGFARGLDIEVIQLCREDFKKELHFDINQINTIFYSTPDDLKEKLTKRLKATISIFG